MPFFQSSDNKKYDSKAKWRRKFQPKSLSLATAAPASHYIIEMPVALVLTSST